jgi:hypothetical protein
LILADSPFKTVSTASAKCTGLSTVELVVRVSWLMKMVVDLEFKFWGMLNIEEIRLSCQRVLKLQTVTEPLVFNVVL